MARFEYRNAGNTSSTQKSLSSRLTPANCSLFSPSTASHQSPFSKLFHKKWISHARTQHRRSTCVPLQQPQMTDCVTFEISIVSCPGCLQLAAARNGAAPQEATKKICGPSIGVKSKAASEAVTIRGVGTGSEPIPPRLRSNERAYRLNS
jgi:hypothetical protein